MQRVAQENDLANITGVQVEIGKFSGVEPAALEFAWGFVNKETTAAGSVLEIIRPPLMLHCENCRQDYEGNLEDFRCPHCQGENFKIIQGREMLVRAVTGDKAEEQASGNGSLPSV